MGFPFTRDFPLYLSSLDKGFAFTICNLYGIFLYVFFFYKGIDVYFENVRFAHRAKCSAVQRSAAQNRSAERRSGGAEERRSGGAEERRSGAPQRSAAAQRRSAAQRRNTKKKKPSRKTTITTKTHKTKMFKLVWLRGPLSQTSLNIFICFCCLLFVPCVFCLLI